MATYILTIGGVERELRVGSLNWQSVINGRDVLSCEVVSINGAYRPAVGQVVGLSEDGTAVFGGFIDYTEETGVDGQELPDIATRITARAFNIYADRRYVTESVEQDTTLEAFLTTLVDDYLSDYGVTLDAAQVTGPNLDAWDIDGEILSGVLDKLTTLTGYVWEIDASKVFRMFAPGSVAAPSDVVDGDGNHVGDIRVKRTRQKYANRVIVKYGQNVIVPHVDTFTGDGAEDTFELTYLIAGPIPYTVSDGAVGNAVVDIDGGTESLAGVDAPSGFIWEYDPSARTIRRRPGPVDNGVSFTVRYDVQYPQTVVVEDAGEISAEGIFETVVAYPDVYDKAVATALGEALLSEYLAVAVEVEYDTYAIGLQPGQTQTITAADRNINGSFLISEVTARNLANSQDIIRSIRAVEGTTFNGSFRDVYKAWLANGSGGSSSSGTPSAAGSGGVPGPPDTSVQFNRGGIFGGDADFTWDETNNNLICGSGGTITGEAEACQVLGDDCHIGGSW